MRCVAGRDSAWRKLCGLCVNLVLNRFLAKAQRAAKLAKGVEVLTCSLAPRISLLFARRIIYCAGRAVAKFAKLMKGRHGRSLGSGGQANFRPRIWRIGQMKTDDRPGSAAAARSAGKFTSRWLAAHLPASDFATALTVLGMNLTDAFIEYSLSRSTMR